MARVQLLALLCLAASSLSLGAQATTGADATKVGVYELKLGDFSVKVTNWGARLMSVVLPDSKGSSVQSSLISFLLSPLHIYALMWSSPSPLVAAIISSIGS